MRKTKTLAFIVLGSALAVAGCGGSDDDEDGGGEVTLTAITKDNAPKVSGVVASAASVLFDVALSASGGVTFGVVTQAPSGHGYAGLAPLAASKLMALVGRTMTPSSAVGSVYTDRIPCDISGYYDVVQNDADGSLDLSTGDSGKLTFVNCVDYETTTNGTIEINNIQVFSSTQLAADFVFRSLTVVEGSDTVAANGSFNLKFDIPSDAPATYELSGSALTVTYNGDEHQLTSFSSLAVIDLLGTYAYRFTGGVSDSSAGVNVNAQTLADFKGSQADDHPSEGQMQMTGLANSRALLRALSSSDVAIDVDANGDGTYEDTISTTWSAIESAF